jgi:hypothetical protein
MKAFLILFGALLLMALAPQTCVGQSKYGALYVTQVEHPPALWEQIYHETERCLKKTGDYGDVQWYTTTVPWDRGNNRGLTWGLWRDMDGPNQIIVVLGDTALIRHESVHDILARNGFQPDKRSGASDPEHPSPEFDVCARHYFPADYQIVRP